MNPGSWPGVDPAWSRTVSVELGDGRTAAVHALDSWNGREGTPALTLLCVHGNPTWSYLWRRLLQQAPAEWRVVAVDQIGMGWSDRVSGSRRLAQRVEDLGRIADALDVHGPVVTVAHDWGGPVSLGWALAHRDQLVGVVLTNTAVSQPPGSPAPTVIRAVRLPGVLRTTTVTTTAFIRGALAMGGPSDPDERAAYLAPYSSAERRSAIGDFVADIPLDPSHPSYATLAAIAEGVQSLDVPVLLLWGPDDPVFNDLYLRDLIGRIPHAEVHRFEGASHLVIEHSPDVATTLLSFLHEGVLSAHRSSLSAPLTAGEPRRDLLAALRERSAHSDTADALAVVELSGPIPRSTTWRELANRVDAVARGLLASGVQPGDRVALLIPPGADLTIAAYACWRIGAVVVAVDAALGAKGIRRALRGAGPQHLIAVPRGIVAARALRLAIPGRVIVAGRMTTAVRTAGATHSLVDLAASNPSVLPPMPEPSAEAAVVFTSGATGPSKGVVYRHAALCAQRDALTKLYGITASDSLVAAFAPWAVLGPALGIASVVPDVNVSSPGTLKATALADAALAIGATLVWASPAALRSVVATADSLSTVQRVALTRVRLLMSAGAPVAPQLLEQVATLVPSAELHTPYGMTEVLPVADIDLTELRNVTGEGVCVGRPVPGVALAISALDSTGAATGTASQESGVVGEVMVSAAHAKDRYDRLWATERESARDQGWHRTGDVGHRDEEGRLWIEGRLPHVIVTDRGVVTPVGVELAVESLPWVRQAAAVGVGPRGIQQLVIVVVPIFDVTDSSALALKFIDEVRQAVGSQRPPVAAVLTRASLPVDTRHNSKVDRNALSAWADGLLAGSLRSEDLA